MNKELLASVKRTANTILVPVDGIVDGDTYNDVLDFAERELNTQEIESHSVSVEGTKYLQFNKREK